MISNGKDGINCRDCKDAWNGCGRIGVMDGN